MTPSKRYQDWQQVYHHHEGELMKLFESPGAIFVDVGAHAGRWTLPMARFFRRVVAIEPNLDAYRVLTGNVKKAGLVNVYAFNIGLSSEDGVKTLSELDGIPSRSTLYPEFSRWPVTKQTRVHMVRLDSWLSSSVGKISFIKIDVEGSEVEVLKGAQETLKKWRPRICVEAHSDRLYNGCCSLLESLGLDFRTEIVAEDRHRYIVRTVGRS
jgi:FkbM family methyltransferase